LAAVLFESAGGSSFLKVRKQFFLKVQALFSPHLREDYGGSACLTTGWRQFFFESAGGSSFLKVRKQFFLKVQATRMETFSFLVPICEKDYGGSAPNLDLGG
jgi:hypothetical protein